MRDRTHFGFEEFQSTLVCNFVIAPVLTNVEVVVDKTMNIHLYERCQRAQSVRRKSLT